MKRVTEFLLILFSISCLNAQNAKKTIAVLDLDPTGIAPTDAQFLTDRLRTELFQTGAFQVVERDKMNAILAEQGFQRTGCTTVECAVEIGQLLNVKNIVAGSIGKIEELYSISLRMIDVQSGMIIKTATRDYRGKLSEVLTDIIPEIAAALAKEEKTATRTEITGIKETGSKTKTGEKFGVMLKAGLAFLGYTKDANDAVDKSNQSDDYFDEYSDHRNIALEVNYFISTRWQVKLNLGFEKMLNSWGNESYFVHIASSIKNFAHKFKFTNLGLGINYYLLKRPAKFDWYVGTDMGSTELNVHVTTVTMMDEVFDKTYTYNAFAFKLATGCGYFLFKSLRLGLELALQATGTFDLSNQKILPDPYTLSVPVEVKEDLLLLKKINGSGSQLNIILSYHF